MNIEDIKVKYRSQKEASLDPHRNSTNNSKNIGPYILGEGTFGKVKLATHILTGEKVAVKILEKLKIIEQSDKARVEREIKILKLLRHYNVIQIYQIIQTRTNLYLIMEYAPGDELFKYICSKRRLSEVEACKYFQQIITGVEYLHKMRIVHRDLKPENLLLDHNKDIKIVDFGLSNIYAKNELLKTPCGSPCYAAPEMIDGKRYNGLLVDIWSCGIVLFAMICGFLPFDDTNNDILYKKITIGEYKVPTFVSDKARDLIKRILTVDPSQRYNIKQIKTHPWFNLVKTKLNKGIFISIHKIPIDYNIMRKMEEYGFEEEEVIEHLRENKHDHVTTTYYLLLKKHSKGGETSVADLISNEFIQYISDPKNLINYKEEEEEKTKQNSQLDSLGKYSFSTPKNKETAKNIFDDSLEKKDKSEKSIKISSVFVNENEQCDIKRDVTPEQKKFVKIEKPLNNIINNKRPIKNIKKELLSKLKESKKQETKQKKENKTIAKKNSFNSDKKTSITINNVNTNISINTTINVPQNNDTKTILLDNSNNIDLNKLKGIRKDPIKPEDYIKIIVNNNFTDKQREKLKNKKENHSKKYNFATNFIDTSTSFDVNIDRRNKSLDPQEKNSLRIEMNIVKKGENSGWVPKKIETVNMLTDPGQDEAISNKRKSNLKGDFQIINEDEEYTKNKELQAKSLKSKFQTQNDKIDPNNQTANIKNKKKNEVQGLIKHIKSPSEISQIRNLSIISRNIAKSKNSDDLLKNNILKSIPASKFNTINIPGKVAVNKKAIVSTRLPEKIRTTICTPKSKIIKAFERDSLIKNKINVVENPGSVSLNSTFTKFSDKLSLESNLSEIRKFSDPFDLQCVSCRHPVTIKEDLTKLLESENIRFKIFGNQFRFRCNIADIKFELEILNMGDNEIFYLKFMKIEGSQAFFLDVSSKLLSKLKL